MILFDIDKQFDNFLKHSKMGANINTIIYKNTKNMYVLGASAMFTQLLKKIKDIPADEIDKSIIETSIHIKNYLKGINKGHK